MLQITLETPDLVVDTAGGIRAATVRLSQVPCRNYTKPTCDEGKTEGHTTDDYRNQVGPFVVIIGRRRCGRQFGGC